jgi:hypothetical protein
MVLTPQCLICGREFTDPVSMSRLIEPECAGPASLDGAMVELLLAEAALTA